MTLIIVGIFQFHSKSEHKYEKRNKIKRDMCKSDSISPYLAVHYLNDFEISC